MNGPARSAVQALALVALVAAVWGGGHFFLNRSYQDVMKTVSKPPPAGAYLPKDYKPILPPGGYHPYTPVTTFNPPPSSYAVPPMSSPPRMYSAPPPPRVYTPQMR